ncbi:acryloyl-CoA reductase electron transfer subunit gamma [Dysosmobacter sp.]|uniref:acryloyl-CoA reductase electron transfer subunit gamma n=1 Tax=Dysosmobacter sp. TaxID=2591382 RepID=UPI001BB47BE9|nr:acryloyl-CoA reductase electron transfer subunit gamma [Dysosmobacter sp.]MDY5509827.1 acryloyl-CoA reductase electron transfer subunit gamma [Dysosmobacter sp.]QUO38589.1 electron transfer flavoprotein subunit beta/FixA family protein [Dysosmobacter sp. Marseille-Q4140]
MKIIVSIKQVPDTSGKVAVNPDGTLNRASMQTITNPDDMNALEAALKLKDATGCKVVVVTMGPAPAAGMLREALAMGADEAVLVSAREFGGSDTYATSQILAAAINKIGVEADDIVMCGRQAIDGDTAQVGPQIAEKLHLPQVTYAADIQKDGDTVTVKRMLEDGYMTIKVRTPCLLTCVKELNEPRLMNVVDIYRAYSKPLETYNYETLKDDPLIDATTIGLKGSPTNIFKSFTPPQKGAGQMLEGADKATCEQLAEILAKKHII